MFTSITTDPNLLGAIKLSREQDYINARGTRLGRINLCLFLGAQKFKTLPRHNTISSY